ncbi:MAG: ATP-binding protein [Clostridia bacterium]|nr:ATP-binding protein [Clostridia bacterium]
MTIRESIIAAAENELESRRRRAELTFERRRAEFLESRPELAELQARLNYIRICDDYLSMGAQVPAAVRSVAGERYAYLFGMDEAGLSHEREAAEAEYKNRAGALAEAGAEGGRYYCPRCRDTGFVSAPDGEIVRCGCFGQLLRDEIVKASGLPAGSTSFDKIELTVYGSGSGNTDDPRRSAEKAYAAAGNFARGDCTDGRTLMFITGKVGVGKTYLACAAGLEAAAHGRFVYYGGVSDILDALQFRVFNSDEDREAYDARREYISGADMLIIDDLGVENITDRRFESLITLLDRRKGDGLKTVITSNLGLGEIARVYGERLASRFADRSSTINLRLTGDDLRLIKKQ